ncbi:bifunctional phosphoribosyl-AMP cyclohydrolase/phosphoribosyl-ATP diphosphatase HisIE [Aequorivita sp. SDUM287046]|uniref:Histidine biosynthesis bifunctional protein HisIE n=1 Tax=Aequorivita aurantiaca TaxID=3053356 RepID=A0ABT8DJQ3_9FLAO|nr:bifunctional phosphoribosyl-AMP cyclohydrolase/phosphoribosyl-ATP diphosphatase HisIE [Aequorivita aurantiaca]MDN3723473.1 bifunctional phosphoribosyl-AMP cyclohydrolase/phosphoribosyl-ATP diphosphatase HisIE [Aequorivita aurantiaca]
MEIDFKKFKDGLVPAIIQDNITQNVLMLGYMDESAFLRTKQFKQVTFYSRSKKRLWTKGEESGNFLEVVSIAIDCDNDALLIKVNPTGPVCHKGTDTCWGNQNIVEYGFLSVLEKTIHNRKNASTNEGSYIASLFEKGMNKIAQKVGEETIEMIIEAKDTNDELFLNESADLLFHYLILLQAKGFTLQDIVKKLQQRHKAE